MRIIKSCQWFVRIKVKFNDIYKGWSSLILKYRDHIYDLALLFDRPPKEYPKRDSSNKVAAGQRPTLQKIRYESRLLYTDSAPEVRVGLVIHRERIRGEKKAPFTLRMCEICCRRARMMSQGRNDAELLNVVRFIETGEVAPRYSNRA